jgi:hypothetical protein
LFSIIICAGKSKFSCYHTIGHKGCFQHDPTCKLFCKFNGYWLFVLNYSILSLINCTFAVDSCWQEACISLYKIYSGIVVFCWSYSLEYLMHMSLIYFCLFLDANYNIEEQIFISKVKEKANQKIQKLKS